MIVEEVDGRRTWIIHPGDEVKLSSGDVGPDDLYRCEGKGGVNGTPRPGTGVVSGGMFSVETAEDGTVSLWCEAVPPGNI